MKEYRIAVKSTVGFSIVAASEAEAIAKANKWREEMGEIHNVENRVTCEDEVIGLTTAAMDVAVYLDDEVTTDDIEDTLECEE